MSKRSLEKIVTSYDAGDSITNEEMSRLYNHVVDLENTMSATGMSWRARFGYNTMVKSLSSYLEARRIEFSAPSREDRDNRKSVFNTFTAGLATEEELETISGLLQDALDTLTAFGEDKGIGSFFALTLEQAQLSAGTDYQP